MNSFFRHAFGVRASSVPYWQRVYLHGFRIQHFCANEMARGFHMFRTAILKIGLVGSALVFFASQFPALLNVYVDKGFRQHALND